LLYASAVPFELPAHRDNRCPFCTNVMGGNQMAVVHQDDETYAFVNPRMSGLGHLLVIPKRHASTLLDLDVAEAQALMRQVHRLSHALMRAFDPSGLNVFQNNGVTAGQTVLTTTCTSCRATREMPRGASSIQPRRNVHPSTSVYKSPHGSSRSCANSG